MGTRRKGKVVSLSGDPVEHYQEGPPSFLPPPAELGTEAIVRHIERHLGPVESVFHELISDAVHLDVHWVKPTAARSFHLLVTSGMSDRPMKVPAELEAPRHIELVATLPERWAIGDEAFRNENWYWPVRQLKTLARFPHKYDTWLGEGHTVANDDPPQPFAPSTRLCGAILLRPQQVPQAFHELRLGDGRTIRFLAVVPVHDKEMALKTRSGTEALLERFHQAGVTDVIEPTRPSVAR
jgi:Suppressor of fused protein (SUFU)